MFPSLNQTGTSTWPRRLLRSEEHTSELQSHLNLVCRLLLEKKKNTPNRNHRIVQMHYRSPAALPRAVPAERGPPMKVMRAHPSDNSDRHSTNALFSHEGSR